MIYRCHKEDHPYYEWYGARGIKVCDRWHDFLNFYLDMGYPEPGQTIERIDNARGYEPGNCCWVTMKEQARNKRGLHVIEHAGKRWCATDLAHEYGMHPQTLMARMKRGMSASEALAKPVKSAGRRAYVSTRQQARVPSKRPIMPTCTNCQDKGWVCESHPDRPWDKKLLGGCVCNSGMPCPVCGGDFAMRESDDLASGNHTERTAADRRT